MANRTSLNLMNSKEAYAKSYSDEASGEEDAYIQIGDINYRLPLLWMAAFRMEDIQTFILPPEEGDEVDLFEEDDEDADEDEDQDSDDEGDGEDEDLPVLITTREKGIANLREAKKPFTKYLARDGYLDQYVDLLISVLESHSEKYLVFDVWDVATMMDLEEFDEKLRACLSLFTADPDKQCLEAAMNLSALNFQEPIFPIKGLYNRKDEHWGQTNALLGGFDETPKILHEDPDPNEALGKFEPEDDE